MTDELTPFPPDPSSERETPAVGMMTASTPTAPYTHIRRFSYTGGVQNFTVPPGVTTINARCWGGGGGGSAAHGGGGGFATGNIAVVPGETLRVVVDLGGGPYSGGGMSGLYNQRLGQTLLIAGGGGAYWPGNNTDSAAARGGAGGGASGSDAKGYSRGGSPGTPARGASGSTGGAGATRYGAYGGRGGNTGQNGGADVTGTSGGQVPIPGMGGGGGAGYGSNTGGGAGYVGGGGGIALGHATSAYFSGGGGSSFVSGPGVTGGRTLPGNGTRAGGQDDPQYQSGVGDAGKRGQVVVQWREIDPSVVLDPGEGAEVWVRRPSIRGTGEEGATVTVAFGGGVPNASVQADERGEWSVEPGADLPCGPVTVTVVQAKDGLTSPPTRRGFTVGAPFVVAPGGPPDVVLAQGGPDGYPGVTVKSRDGGLLGRQTVRVSLPEDAGLQWGGTPEQPEYQLTVLDGDVCYGQPSPDGRTLTFENVELDTLGDTTVMWVPVRAATGATLGRTSVMFSVGCGSSPSTPIDVQRAFEVRPGGPPDVALEVGGGVGYPGVAVDRRARTGKQTVTVRLPGAGAWSGERTATRPGGS
ncbi:hypothetical protein IPZ58_16360 [Streptomyces roseoverticillatus]|uniref:hypothetical protein n=1 Tax=Streptomyces roseoverticillatus TaxID=66429 RepID=UPI001F159F13|nr:hypothetical protein [Streptomyces roseoverticillatus]MCF3103145.1 hypothetical protein [Streptomyces roseoverticillatus]